MVSVRDAQERILERISVLDPLELSVTEAHGCVLAETVTAPEDLPPTPSSALDGFALRAEDTATAQDNAVSLTIIGEASNGRPFAGRVAFGEAVRVSAGAPMPEGADAIVRREDVAVVGHSMAIGRSLRPFENVRPAGEDVARGDPVMQEGQRIRGMDVGVLAALGRARVLVRPRPRVVTFATPAELPSLPASQPGDGGRDPASFAIAGMAREAGSEITRGGVVAQDADALREKFQSYLPQADVFLTCGGISDHAESHVRAAVDKLGNFESWQISARPELSVALGRIQGRTFFGLPDSPVGVVLCFELFVRPALLKLAGRKTVYRPEVDAFLDETVQPDAGKETYLRVRAWRDEAGWRARLSGRQGPGVVSTVAAANAFAVLPANRNQLSPGEAVKLILLEPLEGW